MKKVGKVLKYIFLAFIVVFNVAMIVRVQIQKDTSTLNGIVSNDILKAAYRQNGGDNFAEDHEIPETMTASGDFSVYALHYIPSASQLQVTVRMNQAVLDDRSADSLDYFTFNITDQYENAIPESGRVTAKKLMYNYIRLTFDNVTLPEEYQLHLEAHTPTARLAGLVLYEPLADETPHKLTKSEIAALK